MVSFLKTYTLSCVDELAAVKGQLNVLEAVVEAHKNNTMEALSLQSIEIQRRLQTVGEALRLCTDLVKRDESITVIHGNSSTTGVERNSHLLNGNKYIERKSSS